MNKVAIIDNRVDFNIIKKKSYKVIYIDENNKCKEDDIHYEEANNVPIISTLGILLTASTNCATSTYVYVRSVKSKNPSCPNISF